MVFTHKVNDTELVFDVGKKFESVKQVEIYNDNPFHGKGDFYISVTYEIATPEYFHNGLYQADDAGITKICVGTRKSCRINCSNQRLFLHVK